MREHQKKEIEKNVVMKKTKDNENRIKISKKRIKTGKMKEATRKRGKENEMNPREQMKIKKIILIRNTWLY